MKGETKRKANDVYSETSLASKHNVKTNSINNIHFVNYIATTFCIVFVKRLGELLEFAKFLINFMRYFHNAKIEARIYSQN